MTKIIEINNLTKKYKAFKAVDNISLVIEEGEIFGFIGPNGAGKSTTIKMLLNFIFPTSGEAKILGMDCVKQSIEIKKLVGYVSSDVRYYHEMTSLDIFKYTAEFHGVKNSKAVIQHYLDYFEIEPNKKISDLSLGNKKKVAIVSALLQNPKLLILDEPTNGLDPMIQHRLFEVLEEKSREGVTIFLSSHDLHEIQTHCDRAAFIKNGQIISIEAINKGKEIEKKVILSAKNIKQESLEEIGATQVKQNDENWQFIYKEAVNPLLQLLSQYDVADIEIKPLDLEDKFLSMYE
ncbi:MAG: ABC transporter ATP-binding protein [Vagococcus sp.]|uniref:ABC transporter ATP-binding protein n=1 Tax=Vagococcus sp. TaxID=1933889 RepID=UPI002FCB541F